MSQLNGKFVIDNTINELKYRMRNNLPQRARNAGDNADIELFKLSASDVFEILREMSLSSNKITNLAEGTAATDAVNLGQVQALLAGLKDPKDATKAATTAALPASTYDNGTNGTGATLTANSNGAFPSQDGVALGLDERLLVKNQLDQTQNGIYKLSQVGDAGTPWVLTRTDDASIGGGDATNEPDGNQVTQGMNVPVSEGAENGGIAFIMTTPDPISLGSSNLNFIKLGETILAGQGLVKTGSTISVDNGAGLGFSGNALVVLVDDDLVDGTTKIGGSSELVGRRRFETEFIITNTDISNGYVDLPRVASRDSVIVFPRVGIKQKDGVDFSVSYTGGASGKTRVTFLGDLTTLLDVGDALDVNHESLDF